MSLRGKLAVEAMRRTAVEIATNQFLGADEFTIRRRLPKRPGIKAGAFRGVSRLLGRKGIQTLPGRVYGGLSFHPFNLIPGPDPLSFMDESGIESHSSSGGKSGPVPSRSTRTQRSRRDGSYSSRRASRSPSSGRRRKRCAHRDKRGRQCLRPARHGGRHRYQ